MCSLKVSKSEKKNSILLFSLVYSLHFTFCHIVWNFLNFQHLAKMLKFIFIKVVCSLRYLKWLNFVQKKCLRGQTLCLHVKINLFQDDMTNCFPKKMQVIGRYPQGHGRKVSKPWLIGHSRSSKISDFWGSKQAPYVRKSRPYIHT